MNNLQNILLILKKKFKTLLLPLTTSFKAIYSWIFIVFIITCSISVYGQSDESASKNAFPEPPIESDSHFKINADLRQRFEGLDPQFRKNKMGDDQIISLRSLVKFTYTKSKWNFVLELADSRQLFADEVSNINNSIVNSFDILQGYVQYNFGPGTRTKSSYLKIGKFTKDLGSRRLVARNRFRNTINSFVGAYAYWKFKNDWEFTSLLTMPVVRQPNELESLLDNDFAFDRFTPDYLFGGIFLAKTNKDKNYTSEFFALGLHEKDSSWRNSRNRRLVTVGSRLLRKKKKGKLDFEFESYLQVGKSRASSNPADDQNLEHIAHFQHAYIGYTFSLNWSPRVVFLFDYASGDTSQDDFDHNRFDTMFGARRSDLGPTSIHGAFARSNLKTIGGKFEVAPFPKFTLEVFYRTFWLASRRDAWTTSKLRDATGNSGDRIGNQLDIRTRYNFFSNRLKVEAGIAHLFSGPFIKNAPDSNAEPGHTYCYIQTNYFY